MICRAPVGVARREVYTAADCNATTCGEVSMKRVGILVLILCLAGVVVSLSACGQKGPLYLPKDTPTKQGSRPCSSARESAFYAAQQRRTARAAARARSVRNMRSTSFLLCSLPVFFLRIP